MKKYLLLAAIAALLSVPAAAEDAAPNKALVSLRTWFKHLKDGLSESSVSNMRQRRSATAVAAVRGDKQELQGLERPTWKSGAGDAAARAGKKERKALVSAVDLILAGKPDEGLAALDAFEKSYPASTLKDTVAEARANAKELKAASAAPPPPAPAAEPPPAPAPDAK